MKIGIDISRAFVKEGTGTEEYSRQLVTHLASMDTGADKFFLYVKEGTKIDFTLPSNFSVREVRGNFLWTQWHLAWELWIHPVDVFFVLAHTIPFLHPRKSVVTVHGLEFKNCPDCYTWKQRRILERDTRFSIASAAKIIVPSENTKRDIVKFYKVPLEKISVVYHGAPVVSDIEKKNNREVFNILFVGRMEKRKNVARMVRAFGMFMQKMEESSPGCGENVRLILAGKVGYGHKEIQKEITKSAYGKNIIEKGYVSEKEKEKLYADADVFLFPSLAEGFGLPVLEAMSYGVSVVTSRETALAEIAGDAALLVDPTREEDIAYALWKLFVSLEEGENLVRKGYENLHRFSWEKCARETLDVLKKWK
ncbi:MAG: glycosyltransferase family 1 protein [Candidatus Paceibacterota bacterium]